MSKGTPKNPDAVWVSLEPAFEHIHELVALGMSQKQIGDAAGVDPQLVHYIVRRKRKHIRKATSDAIMAVKWEQKYQDDEKHPLGPTQRRIGALNRIGWPGTLIAEEAGMSQAVLSQLMQKGSRRLYVWAPQALGVQVAYDKYSGTPGIYDFVRLQARVQGWPPPQAWLDGELDDPEPTVLDRVKARWAKLDQPSAGEQLFDLIEANDYTLEEVSERLDVGITAVRRWVSDRGAVRGGYYRQLCEMLGVQELPVPVASKISGGRQPRR